MDEPNDKSGPWLTRLIIGLLLLLVLSVILNIANSLMGIRTQAALQRSIEAREAAWQALEEEERG